MKSYFESSQVSAFRLARHHFLDHQPTDLVKICGDVCGVQAQVMSAARMALWARNRGLTARDFDSALNESRTLVRTSCMRQTLHLLPVADFPIYIAALRPSRVEAVRRVMSRFGVTEKEGDRLNVAILDALSAGPMTQRQLGEQIRPRVGKAVRSWMDRAWSVFRMTMAEGLVCYGPDRGQEVSLVRVDQWLSLTTRCSEQEAKQIILRRYLSAYGPATQQDFSRWSGMSMRETTPLWTSMADEFIEVTIDGVKASVLREDCEHIMNLGLREPILRLLPGFDPYLLAHADKGHLVDGLFYKRVYRNQGWISPVVLLNGRVIGIWSVVRRGKGISIEMELFQKASRSTRAKIEQEAASLGQFLENSVTVSYAQ